MSKFIDIGIYFDDLKWCNKDIVELKNLRFKIEFKFANKQRFKI